MIARNQRHNTTSQYASSINLESAGTARDSGNSETNLAVVLVGITTMHLLCHALRVFLAVYAVSYALYNQLKILKSQILILGIRELTKLQ